VPICSTNTCESLSQAELIRERGFQRASEREREREEEQRIFRLVQLPYLHTTTTPPPQFGTMSTSSVVSMIGILLSAYALYVEYKVHHLAEGEHFTAMCDIEAISASCRFVFRFCCFGFLLFWLSSVSIGLLLPYDNCVVYGLPCALG
jgi:hypothetical protein